MLAITISIRQRYGGAWNYWRIDIQGKAHLGALIIIIKITEVQTWLLNPRNVPSWNAL